MKNFGPYEIVSLLGKGGMGEVYRARDTRLGRHVALKVLPEIFAKDPERMARFQREAEVLASLNHPNIAALYGVDESEGVRALVMELVEGPTLTGPLPLDEALPIARQIAEALEYAHEKGIVHRDLKPANVKVTPEGVVKVLDFGLALLGDGGQGPGVGAETVSAALTRVGVILGTAAYMSPEQAKGKPVDRRADIWSFGVVLYEMLTGRPLYSGETAAETLACVMMKEPGLDLLPATTPPAIRALLARCLDKDPHSRLRDIGEARVVLEAREPQPQITTKTPRHQERPRFSLVSWCLGGGIAVFAAAISLLHFRETPPPEPRPVRFSVHLPEKTSLDTFTLSPDGRSLAMAVSAENKNSLWLRPLDALEAHRLPGTDDARFPFWSPDSRFIGFFADGKLKKMAVTGGPPQTLCDAATGFGGTWSQEGVIVFTPSNTGPMYRVSAVGGTPVPLSGAEYSGGGARFASFLPDGRRFLYFNGRSQSSESGIYAGSLEAGAGRRLLPDFSNALYAPGPAGRNGHLLFVRDETLLAQPFDPGRLQPAGELFPIAERIGSSNRNPYYKRFSVSPAGVLAYWGGGASGSQLVWFDRDGKRLGAAGESGLYVDLALAPDQKKVAVARRERVVGSNLWVLDLARGSASRLTFDPTWDTVPVWSPDGNRIGFSSQRDGQYAIYQKAAAGTGADELVFKTASGANLMDWSRDGRYIVYGARVKAGSELWLLPLAGDRLQKGTPVRIVPAEGEFIKSNARFSPDGRWLAYHSSETGRMEVYVQPVPGPEGARSVAPGAKWQISTTGGMAPVWRSDGKELFYLGLDLRLMAVPLTAGSTMEAGAPQALFQTRALPPGPTVFHPYDVSPDGRRFLINTLGESEQSPITVVVNWQAGLR